MEVDLDDKISSIIGGCKTVEQLNVAQRYVDLARKGGFICTRRYHFMWGVITALKGVLGRNT